MEHEAIHWDLPSFLIHVFIGRNVTVSTNLTASHKLCYVLKIFSHVPCDLFFDQLVISVFNFQIFINFQNLFQLLISNLIPMWSGNIHSIIPIILNLLMFVLWLSILYSMENILCCVFGKNVYSFVYWSVLEILSVLIGYRIVQVSYFLVDLLPSYSTH